MPRYKSPPRVKGPYSERDGTRFRIRICEQAEHRNLYFSTMKEALAAMKEAAAEFLQAGYARTPGRLLACPVADKVKRGLCNPWSEREYQDPPQWWIHDYLDDENDRHLRVRDPDCGRDQAVGRRT